MEEYDVEEALEDGANDLDLLLVAQALREVRHGLEQQLALVLEARRVYESRTSSMREA